MSRSSPAYVRASKLHELLSSDETRSGTLVVDVRDEDRAGGHVAGSLHVPSESFHHDIERVRLAARGKQIVVFHCMQSQQRGPRCAMIMAQAVAKQQQEEENAAAASGSASATATAEAFPPIVILEDGFSGWVRYVSRLESDVRQKHRDLLIADYSKTTHGYNC